MSIEQAHLRQKLEAARAEVEALEQQLREEETRDPPTGLDRILQERRERAQ
jgi:small-conductance mechanosensitive channel